MRKLTIFLPPLMASIVIIIIWYLWASEGGVSAGDWSVLGETLGVFAPFLVSYVASVTAYLGLKSFEQKEVERNQHLDVANTNVAIARVQWAIENINSKNKLVSDFSLNNLRWFAENSKDGLVDSKYLKESIDIIMASRNVGDAGVNLLATTRTSVRNDLFYLYDTAVKFYPEIITPKLNAQIQLINEKYDTNFLITPEESAATYVESASEICEKIFSELKQVKGLEEVLHELTVSEDKTEMIRRGFRMKQNS